MVYYWTDTESSSSALRCTVETINFDTPTPDQCYLYSIIIGFFSVFILMQVFLCTFVILLLVFILFRFHLFLFEFEFLFISS